MPYTFKRDAVLSLKSQLQNFVPALMALLALRLFQINKSLVV